jgi:hypothetical protein
LALFLVGNIWGSTKKYSDGTRAAITSNGFYEKRYKSYPNNGLALTKKTKEVLITDSETSAVRKLSLKNGKVSTFDNSFAFFLRICSFSVTLTANNTLPSCSTRLASPTIRKKVKSTEEATQMSLLQ